MKNKKNKQDKKLSLQKLRKLIWMNKPHMKSNAKYLKVVNLHFNQDLVPSN